MGDIVAAQRMLEVFASVGAESFTVTKTDICQKLKWGKPYTLRDLRDKLPAMVRTASTRRPVALPGGETVTAGENLIIRPVSSKTAFIQLDDLTAEQLKRVSSAACVIHETSPGNHQAWIAVSGLTGDKEEFKDVVRRVRKAIGTNDKTASHATRIAGSENFKAKYAPDYPTVTILEAHPGRIATMDKLESLALLAPPEQFNGKAAAVARRNPNASDKVRHWPSYEKALAGAPMNFEGTGPDRSRADYWWCYLALQRNWSIEETESRLLEVSAKARERVANGDRGYVRQTVANASAALPLKAVSFRA